MILLLQMDIRTMRLLMYIYEKWRLINRYFGTHINREVLYISMLRKDSSFLLLLILDNFDNNFYGTSSFFSTYF